MESFYKEAVKMRVLWFTGRMRRQNKAFYGGGGWIRSLATELKKTDRVELAQAYFCDEQVASGNQDGIWQYPMCLATKNKFKKVYDNWFHKPEYSNDYLLRHMNRVITDFNPDVIQIFGTESMFTSLIGRTEVPTILYMQGVINPIHNAYYPYAMNAHTLKYWRFDKREWIFRSGRVFRERQLKELAENEKQVMRKAKYIIGRTSFDYQVSRLFSPESKYYKVNEMMRTPFYEGRLWIRPDSSQYIIFSTLSNVTYKGFDVILKAAALLKERGVDFQWRIAGLNKSADVVALFEYMTGVRSDEVNVNYLGILGEEDLKQELLHSHVLVHPSYIDNSPNSVGEAQLLGLPVIATYVGGIPDFIEKGKTGELVWTNDPYNLAYLIVKDIEAPYLYNYSEPAYEVARKRHDKESIIKDLMGAYNEVLNNNRYGL